MIFNITRGEFDTPVTLLFVILIILACLNSSSFTVYRSLLTLGMYFRFQLEARDIATAYSCSEATHSSLARPATIVDKMPGLTFSETQVITSSVDELVPEIGLNDTRSTELKSSVTGFEELWLDPDVDLMRYFDVVLVRLPGDGTIDTTYTAISCCPIWRCQALLSRLKLSLVDD